MPSVKVREYEPFERALKRLKKAVENDGTFYELKKREFYEKPCDIRKRKKNAAIKRWQKIVEETSLEYMKKKKFMKKKEEKKKRDPFVDPFSGGDFQKPSRRVE